MSIPAPNGSAGSAFASGTPLLMTTTEARPGEKRPATATAGWHYDAAWFPVGQHRSWGEPGTQLADVYARHTLTFALDMDLYKPAEAEAYPVSAAAAWIGDRPPYIRRGAEGSQRYLVAVSPELAAKWWPVAGKMPWGEIRSSGIAPSPGARHPSGDTYEHVAGLDPVRYPDGTVLMTNVLRLDETLIAALEADGAHNRDDRPMTAGDAELPDDDGRCPLALAWLAGADFTGATPRGTRANAAVNYLKRSDAEGHRIGGLIDEVIARLPETSTADFEGMWASAPVLADTVTTEHSCCGDPLGLQAMMAAAARQSMNERDAMDAYVAGAMAAETAVLMRGQVPPAASPGQVPAVRRVVSVPMSQIRPKRVRWTWDKRLAVGELSALGGREGAGKSSLAYDTAARLTRGTLPGEYHGTQRAIAIVSAEDSLESVIAPRLIGAGADMSLARHLRVDTGIDTDTGLVLPLDTGELARELTDTGAVLLILDPIMSRLDARLDAHKDAEVRIALEPLVKMAHATRCTLLGLIHPNKSGTTDALNSLMASRAFAAIPRTVLFVMEDPADENRRRRVLAEVKNNLGPKCPSLVFEIGEKTVAADETDGCPVTAGVLRWLPGWVPSGTVEEMLAAAQRGPGRETSRDRCGQWLEDWLAERGGQAERPEVFAAAKAAGFSADTLKRARPNTEVVIENTETFPRKTLWVLTGTPSSQRTRAGGLVPTAPTGQNGRPGETLDALTTNSPGQPQCAPVSAVSAGVPARGAPTGAAPPQPAATPEQMAAVARAARPVPSPYIPPPPPPVPAAPYVPQPAPAATADTYAVIDSLCSRCGGTVLAAGRCAHHPGETPRQCPVCGR